MNSENKKTWTKEQEDRWKREDEETVAAPGKEWTRQINLRLPVWAIQALDREAERRGTTRQSLIAHWLTDHLDDLSKQKAV